VKVDRHALEILHAEIIECRRCPRLVAWREQVAREKRRAYREETYWGRPLPGFGDPAARLVIVGLAPAAHGGNRTGRMFTGDRSGDFLYAGLFRAGLASQPTSVRRGDGLELRGVFITAPCRCAPPENKPAPEELANCRPWFEQELSLLPNVTAYLALGKTGFDAVVREARAHAGGAALRVPAFGHGVEARIPDPRGGGGEAWLLGSYHVSQQNTQTGRLTEAMFDAVVEQAVVRAGLSALAAAPWEKTRPPTKRPKAG
jgi:uracil-DNA glycosylase family 4